MTNKLTIALSKLLCILNLHKYRDAERDYLTVDGNGYKVIKQPCVRCAICRKFSPAYTKQEWSKFETLKGD